ncbi:MAG: BamA/TamA family outer membrane protein [Bacteroidia bacterium]
MPLSSVLPRLIGVGLVLLLCTRLAAQPGDTLSPARSPLLRLADRVFGEDAPPGQPRYLFYPTLAYAPETSFEFGLSAVALFYAKNDHLRNRLSEVQLFAFVTLERQYGLWLDHAIYGDGDRWFFLGKNRLQRFPLLYYGIGPDVVEAAPSLVQADYLLIRERVLRRVAPNLFLGFEFDLQDLRGGRFEPPPAVLPPGAAGSRNLGLGLGLVYDNRKNVLNTRKGSFAELALLNYSPAWGSDWRFRSWNIDLRHFIPTRSDQTQVLALQVLGQFVQGDAPFNQLALLGGEQMMRGYYTGRYRDNNYLAVQAEYRFLPFPFSRRLGAAAFLAMGSVAPRVGDFSLGDTRAAGGVGLRFLLFPPKDIYVRLDMGLTREGPGFYFYTGEAF